jgi:tetratricopeptide (TPR) repeat protein
MAWSSTRSRPVPNTRIEFVNLRKDWPMAAEWKRLCVLFIAVWMFAPGARAVFAQDESLDDLLTAGFEAVGRGRFAEAEGLLRKAVARAEGEDPEDVRLASILGQLAWAINQQGRSTEAEAVARRALAIQEKRLGPEHLDTSVGLQIVSAVEQAQGEHSEAERLLGRALAIQEKALGPDHPRVVSTLANLAFSASALGKLHRAEVLLKRAQAIQEEEAESPELAMTLYSLGHIEYKRREYAKALPYVKRALDIGRRLLGADHPEVVARLNGLIALYQAWGKYDEARPLAGEALALSRRVLGESHPDTGTSAYNLGCIDQAQGRSEAAEANYRMALAIWEKTLGPDHPNIGMCLDNCANVLHQIGRDDEAARMRERARAIRTIPQQ